MLNSCLLPLASSTLERSPKVTAKVLDGGAIIHMLKPSGSVMFRDFAQNVFLPFILRESKTVARLDIVWDRYVQDFF